MQQYTMQHRNVNSEKSRNLWATFNAAITGKLNVWEACKLVGRMTTALLCRPMMYLCTVTAIYPSSPLKQHSAISFQESLLHKSCYNSFISFFLLVIVFDTRCCPPFLVPYRGPQLTTSCCMWPHVHAMCLHVAGGRTPYGHPSLVTFDSCIAMHVCVQQNLAYLNWWDWPWFGTTWRIAYARLVLVPRLSGIRARAWWQLTAQWHGMSSKLLGYERILVH